MLRILTLLVILAGTAMPLTAEEAAAPADTGDNARHAAAGKLLDLFNMDETYDQAMQQAMNMAVGMIDNQDLEEAEKANARKAVEISMQLSMEKFSWDRMKNVFIDIYATVLDEEELEGLIAFYKSPIGQRFLQKQPQLSLATMGKMQEMMQEMMPALQKAVDEALQLEAVIEIHTE